MHCVWALLLAKCLAYFQNVYSMWWCDEISQATSLSVSHYTWNKSLKFYFLHYQNVKLKEQFSITKFNSTNTFCGHFFCHYLHKTLYSPGNECMGVNGEALQLHTVYKKPYFLLQAMRESVSVLQVTRECISGTTSHMRALHSIVQWNRRFTW